MLVRLVALTSVACAAQAVPVPPPPRRPPPQKWTVTYLTYADVKEAHGDHHAYEPHCTRLVLAEHSVGEHEIAGEIVDGDAAPCGVGTKLRVTYERGGDVAISAEPALDALTWQYVRELHYRLRDPHNARTKMRLSTRVAHVTANAIDYVETTFDGSQPFHGMSDGNQWIAIRLRERATDRALACATYESGSSGAGEYGGFSSRSVETITVDYGDGPPVCR